MFTLLVKGPPAIAKQEALNRGFKVKAVESHKYYRESIVEASHNDMSAPDKWFAEEVSTPLQWGSLIYFAY